MKRRRWLWIGLGAVVLLGSSLIGLITSRNRLDHEIKAIAADYHLTPTSEPINGPLFVSPFEFGYVGKIPSSEWPHLEKALSDCSRRCGLDTDTGLSHFPYTVGGPQAMAREWKREATTTSRMQSLRLLVTYEGPSRVNIYVLALGDERGVGERISDWWRSVTLRP